MKLKNLLLLLLLIILSTGISKCKRQNEFADKEHLSLRSEYKEINDFKEIKNMILKFDFFDKRKNRSGSFNGKVKEQKIDECTVILDYKTGLMWMAQERNDPTWINLDNNIRWLETFNFTDAEKMTEMLNKSIKGYAGFKDWRLPTIEEAASLLRPQKKPNTLFLPDSFSNKNTLLLYIWTGDYYNRNINKKKNMIWTVSFAAGSIFRESHKNPQFLKLVRKFNPMK